jgi:hypothetical protein
VRVKDCADSPQHALRHSRLRSRIACAWRRCGSACRLCQRLCARRRVAVRPSRAGAARVCAPAFAARPLCRRRAWWRSAWWLARAFVVRARRGGRARVSPSQRRAFRCQALFAFGAASLLTLASRAVLADGTLVYSFGRAPEAGRPGGPGGAQEAHAPRGTSERPRVHFLGSPPPTLARIARAQVRGSPHDPASAQQLQKALQPRGASAKSGPKGRSANCRARLTAAASPSRRNAGLGGVM